jgi:hypothetical protein
MFDIADVKPDTAIEAELIAVFERFCSAFADRDASVPSASSHASGPAAATSWSGTRTDDDGSRAPQRPVASQAGSRFVTALSARAKQ